MIKKISKTALVKIAGRVFEFVVSPGTRPKVRELSIDEVADKAIFDSDNFENELGNRLSKLAENAVIELEGDFKRDIKRNILQMLGFESNPYGSTWKVDHCNGRASIVSDMLTAEAKNLVQVDMKGYLQQHFEAIKTELQPSVLVALKDQIKIQMRNTVHTEAERMAKIVVQQIVEEKVKELTEHATESALETFLNKKN